MIDSYTRYQRISRKRALERPGRGGQQGEEAEIGTVSPSLSPLNHLLQKLRVRICKKHLHATYYIILLKASNSTLDREALDHIIIGRSALGSPELLLTNVHQMSDSSVALL
jgi:hypothetical protein